MVTPKQAANIGSASENEAEITQAQLLKDWLSVAESQICALEVLAAQIPKVDKLLEDNVKSLSTHFGDMTTCVEQQKEQFEQLRNMAANSPSVAATVEKLDAILQKINEAISGVIVSMQFQDRTSQNLVITTNVMKAMATYLKTEIDNTLNNFEHCCMTTGQPEKVKLDQEFAKQMILHLKLGELQNNFVKHLLEHGYIEDPADIGHVMSNKSDDEVELF